MTTGSIWEAARWFLEADDSGLIDIVVDKTTDRDWPRFLAVIQRSSWPVSYTRDLVAAPIPASLRQKDAEMASHCVKIVVGVTDCYCHFNSPEQLIFDIDPRDCRSEADFAPVELFMRWLSSTFGRVVYLAPNNVPDIRLIEINTRALS